MVPFSLFCFLWFFVLFFLIFLKFLMLLFISIINDFSHPKGRRDGFFRIWVRVVLCKMWHLEMYVDICCLWFVSKRGYHLFAFREFYWYFVFRNSWSIGALSYYIFCKFCDAFWCLISSGFNSLKYRNEERDKIVKSGSKLFSVILKWHLELSYGLKNSYKDADVYESHQISMLFCPSPFCRPFFFFFLFFVLCSVGVEGLGWRRGVGERGLVLLCDIVLG